MGLPLSEGQEKSRLGEGAGQEPRSAGVQCGVPTKTPTGHVGLGVRGRPGGVGVHSAEALGWPCPGSRGPLAAGPSASRVSSAPLKRCHVLILAGLLLGLPGRGSVRPGRPHSGEVRRAWGCLRGSVRFAAGPADSRNGDSEMHICVGLSSPFVLLSPLPRLPINGTVFWINLQHPGPRLRLCFQMNSKLRHHFVRSI